MANNLVKKEILTRLTNLMKKWFIYLGDYKQRQCTRAQSLDAFFNDLHLKFRGKPEHAKEKALEESLKLKCCFYKLKDLERHFKEITKRCYILERMDDNNLKQAYVESL